eukprot:9647715-Karenia_brevis.AAC.1
MANILYVKVADLAGERLHRQADEKEDALAQRQKVVQKLVELKPDKLFDWRSKQATQKKPVRWSAYKIDFAEYQTKLDEGYSKPQAAEFAINQNKSELP